MQRPHPFLRFALTLLTAPACTSKAPDPANPDPKCHPLAVGDCGLPWPSSFYLTADASTATGFRVNLPMGVLPSNSVGKPMDPTYMNRLDGFSPAGFLLANLKAQVDRTKLPQYSSADLSASLEPSSTVQLLRFDTGDRVPLFAEVDNNARVDDKGKLLEDQVVLIHPMVRLRPSTRYVAVLRDLVDVNGKPVRNPAFDALVAGSFDASSRLSALKPAYDPIFALLAAHGVPKSAVTLAWDFTTGSDAQLTGNLLAMRDGALAAWQAQNLGYTITQTNEPANDADLFRQLLGRFDVPSYLTDDSLYGSLNRGSDGKPLLRAPQSFNLVVHVPQCARTATRPLPFVVFGHGLLGSARGEMGSGYQKHVMNTLCMIEIGTDWVGLAEDDAGAALPKALGDFSYFNTITDRLQQSEVNFLVLARLAVRKLKDDPGLKLGGKALTDGSQIYYYGISQGGIMGNTFMALTPDVQRGTLNVGAGEYSLLLTRSADFTTEKVILDNNSYPAQRDQEMLLAVTQSYWDFSDPITFAPYTLKAPFPDPATHLPMAPKHILQQESIGDGQVSNMATRVLVRTMGLLQLDPPVEPVYGVTVMKGPLDSAYTQWDVHPMPLPGPYNTSPSDNQAHEACRRLDKLIAQLAAFWKPDGQVVQTCVGPCVFPGQGQ